MSCKRIREKRAKIQEEKNFQYICSKSWCFVDADYETASGPDWAYTMPKTIYFKSYKDFFDGKDPDSTLE